MSDAAGQGLEIRPATTPADIDAVRRLFLEYGRSLGFSLCFEGFDAEVAGLPGNYAAPRGTLLLACAGGLAVGCVGVRPLDPDRCEMKRLYLQPEHRGRRAGRRLAEAAITAAGDAGYRRMWLHTLDSMAGARALYAAIGFRPIQAYDDNPLPGVIYCELELIASERLSHVPAA